MFVVLAFSKKQPNGPKPLPAARAPSINTFSLPDAKVGVLYKSEVIASMVGPHRDIIMEVTDLPEGLTMGTCVQTYDTHILTIPNTMTVCSITGITRVARVYQVNVSAKTPNVYLNIVATLPLLVRE